MNILHKPVVLPLNAHWRALAPTTPEKAFTDMIKGTVQGISIVYFQNPDGSYNFEEPLSMEPVTWEKWIELPIRDFDWSVQTPRIAIRVPTVVVCISYAKTPMARKKLTNQAVHERDGWKCGYTGQKLTRRTATVDHYVPKAKGGRTEWTNVLSCHIDVNRAKDDKSAEEAGLKLLRPLKAPPLLPVCATIKQVAHNDWRHFLIK